MFVLKNKRMRFSLCRLGRTPGVELGVAWGHFFPNMVVWHIKLKGMMSRTGYKLNAEIKVILREMYSILIGNYSLLKRPQVI